VLNLPAHWRIPPTAGDLSPFGAGQFGRPLRIVVDSESMAPSPALELLQAFSGRPGVEVFTTDLMSDRRIEFGREDSQRDAVDVRYISPGGETTLVAPAAGSLRTHARMAATEYDLEEQECWRALLLVRVARRHQLDAVVSGAPVLSTSMWTNSARAAGVITAESACALLGLFLRAHNDFTVQTQGGHSTFLPFEQFYRSAAISALPDFAGWLASAWAIWRQQETAKPFALLRAIEARLGRALVARDYVNVRIRHWRPDETWDEALYFFESFLLSLSGALDALARLFDVAAGQSSKRGAVGFRKEAWRKKIVMIAPELEPLLSDGSHFRAVVDLVAILRNFVHGEVLSAELLSDDGAPHFMDYGAGVLALDDAAGRELNAAAVLAGEPAAWGIKAELTGATTVMPIVFQRAALAHALRAIRDAMSTNILVSVAPQSPAVFDTNHWLPASRYASELRLLAGLTPAP
jgi:hypothetical protein